MEEKKKRTQRKSKSLRTKYKDRKTEAVQADASISEEGSEQSGSESSSSRIVDMSWAAEYLNDDWENKHTAKGAYDTKAAAHSSENQEKSEKAAVVDDMSETQQFKAVEDIAGKDDGSGDLVKIRDAETDKTIVSVDEAEKVRAAAGEIPDDSEADSIVKIRDAETDKTIVSVTEAAEIREAAARLQVDEDLDDIVKIRDAETDKTIVSVDEAAGVRAAAAAINMDEGGDDLVKIRDAATDRTIVSVTEASEVRDAASVLEEAAAVSTDDLDNLRDAATLMRATEPDIYFPDKKKTGKKKKETRAAQEPVVNTVQKIEPEDFIKPDDEDIGSTKVLENIIIPQKNSSEQKKNRTRTSDSKSIKNKAASRSRKNNGYYDDDRDDYYDDRDYRRDSITRDDRYDTYDRDYGHENVRYVYEPVKSPLRFIPLVLVIALCVLGFIAAREVCYDVPINAADYSRYSYTVEKGLTDAQLASDLKAMGLIDNPLIFRLRAILYSAKYVEGTYELSPCYSTEKMINILSGYEYVTE